MSDLSEAYKSDLERAVENPSEERIEALNKNETVFFVSAKLGIDPPEDHPSDYNGAVSRGFMQEVAVAVTELVGEEDDG